MNNISLFFRNSRPFSQLVGLLFLFLIGFILATGLQLLLPVGFATPASTRLSLIVQGIAQVIMFFVPALLFVLLYKDNPTSYLMLDFHGRKWLLASVAMIIFLLLVPVNDWITWWNDRWNLGPFEMELRRLSDASKAAVEQLLAFTSIGDLLLQMLVVALIPAICEEIFFRGILQQILRQWFGNIHLVVFVTAIIFSLAHGDIYGLVPRFVLGLLLGYLFYFSGSLLVNVCAHFFNNALIVLYYFLYHKGVLSTSPDTPLLMPWLTTLLCTLAAVALLILYFIKNDKNIVPKQSI